MSERQEQYGVIDEDWETAWLNVGTAIEEDINDALESADVQTLTDLITVNAWATRPRMVRIQHNGRRSIVALDDSSVVFAFDGPEALSEAAEWVRRQGGVM